jgi:hypothetical protein
MRPNQQLTAQGTALVGALCGDYSEPAARQACMDPQPCDDPGPSPLAGPPSPTLSASQLMAWRSTTCPSSLLYRYRISPLLLTAMPAQGQANQGSNVSVVAVHVRYAAGVQLPDAMKLPIGEGAGIAARPCHQVQHGVVHA